MQNLNLKLMKALLGACLLAVQGFASAKAISFSESQTNTHCLFIEQLELADLEGRKLTTPTSKLIALLSLRA